MLSCESDKKVANNLIKTMNKFGITCSCGDAFSVDAATREEAVAKMKGMFDEAGIARHFGEKHPGQPVLSVSEAHAIIEQGLAPVA
jgi:hypothetical protein